MKTHTPGPWIVYQPESIHICYEGEDNPATIRAGGTHVATIPGMRPHLTGNRLANAHLISAAPDLLAALERLAHPMADDEDLDYAREVIAKAKGQQ